jgi:hypothetical protein
MATTTTKKINDLTEGFGDVNERYRVFNEKLIETGKKTSIAALDDLSEGCRKLRRLSGSSSRKRRSSTG